MNPQKLEASSQEPSPTMAPFDLDQYINLDNAVIASPSTSTKGLSVPSPSAILPSNRHQRVPSSSSSSQQQVFAGPSHQYEQYKQQTGLPVGALASTFALNQPASSSFSYSSSSYSLGLPTDGYFGMNTVEPEYIDFGAPPEQTLSGEMDVDFSTTTNSTFVDPAAIQDTISPSVAHPLSQPTHPTQPGRVWPGMHQQQAAQAKAQQQAAHQAAVAAQRQRSASNSSRQASEVQERENEEVVEESISRLLNRMRNSSVASSNGEDGSTPTANGLSHSGRVKKDEEDMDEDERLLASEEGKKLSSKERRQLRNKVSARAFRSRRKEYIGQLEGELAAKAAEADEFKAKNEELVAENKRLTDLTRLLLSSPAFSEFLNDLSGTNGSTSALQDLTQPRSQPTPQTQQQQHKKDANPNQYRSSHSSMHNSTIGMAMIPEEPSYESNVGTPTGYNYNPTVMTNGLYDAQVYAITSLPEPTFDSATLSQKSHADLAPFPTSPKDAPAPIEWLPSPTSKDTPTPIETPDAIAPVADLDDDPTNALFADHPAPVPTATTAATPTEQIFGAIPLEKALERVEITQGAASEDVSGSVDAVTLDRFYRLCGSIESSVVRVKRVTGHLL